MPMQDFSPMLQTTIGAGAAILGSIIAGYYMLEQMRTDKKFESFDELRVKFYSPFLTIAYEIVEENSIDILQRSQLKELIDKNQESILLCPKEMRDCIYTLRKSLKETKYDEKILNEVRLIKEKIEQIVKKYILS